MNSVFFARFPGQIGRWSLHGFCNALPGLVILSYGFGFPDATMWPALLMAVGIHVVFFACVTSLPGPLSDGGHVLSRALRLGLRVRMVLVFLSLPLVFVNGFLLIPDLWLGWASVVLQQKFSDFAHSGGTFSAFPGGEAWGGFWPVFSVAMLTGILISIQLLTICFFCVIFLQSRDRKRFNADLGRSGAGM